MIGVTWTGWDGSNWNLHTGQVRLTDDGIEGLYNLAAQTFTSETALVDGQRYTGWRAQPRKVLMPVLIGQSASALEWLLLERAWWKTMRPDKAGTLTITAPDGSKRSLKLRFESDGGMPMGRDPSQQRLTVAPLVMIADNPWWLTDPVEREFRNGGDAENFLGGATGLATPFIFGKANSVGRVRIENPGDMPAYPIYHLFGDLSAFTISIGGAAVSGIFDILPEQSVDIETAPDRQVAWLNNGTARTNITRQLDKVAFRPVPAGDSVELNITLIGTGSLTIEYIPRHFKAW